MLKNVFITLIVCAVIIFGVVFALQDKIFANQTASVSNGTPSLTIQAEPIILPPQKLANPPEVIKAVYVTANSAGNKNYLDYLTNLFKTTEINAVVVDIKGSSGYVTYESQAENVKKYNLNKDYIKDIDSLVRFFHDQNIYVIGRIAVFEDPVFSKARPELAIYDQEKTTALAKIEPIDSTDLPKPILWKDNNGLSWLDPASKDVWDYNISLAKDAFLHGLDEINFDYIRFPSDGNEANMGFPVWNGKSFKVGIIKNFFQYLNKELRGDPSSPEATTGRGKISADLFGQTTTDVTGMGIGQLIENAFENFDYISPMVYPSHYVYNFLGLGNPAEHPYEIIKYSMAIAQNRENIYLKNKQDAAVQKNITTKPEVTGPHTPVELLEISDSAKKPDVAPIIIPMAKFRPWLQDFNMGADYTADMVKLEIKATQVALGQDYSGFMLWNPSNIYTKDAVIKPN